MLRLSTLALMITTLSAVVVHASSSGGTDHPSACNGFPADNPSWTSLPSGGTCPENSIQSDGLYGTGCLTLISATSVLLTTTPQSDCAIDASDLQNSTSPNVYCDLNSGFGTCWAGYNSNDGYLYFPNCNEPMFANNIDWTNSGTEWELCAFQFSSSSSS
jgi:hypothetical protein